MTQQPTEVRHLPPVVDLVTAARMLGIGRTVAYQLVRRGEWPTPVLRLGHQIKVPSAPLLALLGISPDHAASLPSAPPARHAEATTSS